jgi:hypothetical protein
MVLMGDRFLGDEFDPVRADHALDSALWCGDRDAPALFMNVLVRPG